MHYLHYLLTKYPVAVMLISAAISSAFGAALRIYLFH